MKPFVAIGGVLDYLFAKYFGSVSVEKCAQTENLYCLFKAVPGPAAGHNQPISSIEPLRTDNAGS